MCIMYCSQNYEEKPIILCLNIKTCCKPASLKSPFFSLKLRHLCSVCVVSLNTNRWRRRGHSQTDYRTRLTDSGELRRGGAAHIYNQDTHSLDALKLRLTNSLSFLSPSMRRHTNTKGREDKLIPAVHLRRVWRDTPTPKLFKFTSLSHAEYILSNKCSHSTQNLPKQRSWQHIWCVCRQQSRCYTWQGPLHHSQ